MARKRGALTIGEQMAVRLADSRHRRRVADEIGAMLKEPFEPAAKAGQHVEQLVIHRLDREQRNQTDHRPDANVASWSRRAGEAGRSRTRPRCPTGPHRRRLTAADAIVDRVRDVEEVLEELRRHVLVGVVLSRQLERDGEHVEAEHRHPARAVALIEARAAGQLLAAIEHADVVEPEEAALKDVPAFGVLAVHPPGEVDEQLVKDALEKFHVARARGAPLDLIHAHRRPGVHRRIDVAERPLVGRAAGRSGA